MRVEIRPSTSVEPKGQHYMVVDGHGLHLDLSTVHGGILHDPTITRFRWGLQQDGAQTREGGSIYRQDGARPQVFWENDPLKPYLAAFEARRAAIESKPADVRPDPAS